MTDETKADAIANAFNAMRAQRKARTAEIRHSNQNFWSEAADRADAKAIGAVAALLAVFKS
jgi:hypothetical protein